MNELYHGSRYKNETLKPGFDYSNKEVFWDDTESNKNLYASEDKNSAILMGITGLLEKENSLKKISIVDRNIDIQFYPNEEKIILDKRSTVYLYEISPLPNQNWVKVNNKNNSNFSEYKTTNEINYNKITSINVLSWLSKNGYKLDYVK